MSVTISGSGQIVKQVVNATYSTVESTTSTSFVATSLTATITPTSTTSKILIIYGICEGTGNNTTAGVSSVFRGNASGTNLGTTFGFGQVYANAAGAYGVCGGSYLDSPATTSATTYTVCIRSESGSTVYLNSNGPKSTLTLLEISGS